jgi:hypothetical protein
MNEMGVTARRRTFRRLLQPGHANLDVEIGFPVSRPLPDWGDIKSGALPAGKFARPCISALTTL